MEDRRSKNDKAFREVWKVVEAKVGEGRVAKAKKGREKERSRKEIRREETRERRRKKKEEKTKKEENDKSEENNRGVGNLGWGSRSSEVRRKGKEVGIWAFLLMYIYLWKESQWENANKKVMGLYNWFKERICTEEGKSVLIVKGRKRRGAQVYPNTIEKEAYQTFEVVSNGTSIFYRKKGW